MWLVGTSPSREPDELTKVGRRHGALGLTPLRASTLVRASNIDLHCLRARSVPAREDSLGDKVTVS